MVTQRSNLLYLPSVEALSHGIHSILESRRLWTNWILLTCATNVAMLPQAFTHRLYVYFLNFGCVIALRKLWGRVLCSCCLRRLGTVFEVDTSAPHKLEPIRIATRAAERLAYYTHRSSIFQAVGVERLCGALEAFETNSVCKRRRSTSGSVLQMLSLFHKAS